MGRRRKKKTAGAVWKPTAENKEAQFDADRFFELSLDLLAVASLKDEYWKKVNPAFTHTLGWSEAELLAMPFFDIVHPDDLEKAQEATAWLAKGKDLAQFEERVLCKDGGYKWIAWNTTSCRKKGLVYCIGRDITKQREVEQELAGRYEMLQKIVDHIPVMLVIWDPRLQSFQLNNHTTYILGWTNADANDGDFMAKVYPDADYRAQVSDFMQSLSPKWRELYPTTASGEKVPSAWTNIKLSDDTMIGIGIDIRERKKAEKILERDNETLEELVKIKSKELLDTQKKLEKAKRLSDIGALAATVAHELRNPLSAMSLSVYNLQRKIHDKALAQKLDNINTKITDGEMIIENLLFYSKLRPPQHEEFCPGEVIHESIAEFREVTYREIELIETGTDKLKNLTIMADRHQLKEVIANLLNNAADAVGINGGTVILRTETKDGKLVLNIQDTGEGIEEEHLEKICDPFFTTKARGTGLGLTVCRQIIEMHEGLLTFESERNKGTSVTVSLPIRKAGE